MLTIDLLVSEDGQNLVYSINSEAIIAGLQRIFVNVLAMQQVHPVSVFSSLQRGSFGIDVWNQPLSSSLITLLRHSPGYIAS